MLLFRTPAGSHLYNLAHAGSDLDYYEVISNRPNCRRYSKQIIKDGIDTTTVDLSTFMRHCEIGVPQALESLFSPIAEVDLISDFRHNYYVNTAEAYIRYERTIKSFREAGGFKKIRHSFRLELCLTELLEHGRFQPRLTPAQIEWVTLKTLEVL